MSGRSDQADLACLIGFMGAGKSTVGPILAEELGWTFIDLDEEIVRREGRSIAEIFEVDGEPRFRALEAEIGAEITGRKGVVLSTGGGWGARPGWISELRSGVLSIWLKVEPEVAVNRVQRQAPGRPLLDTSTDPERVAAELLAARSPYYASAELHIETTGRGPTEVVSAILNQAGLRLSPGTS